MARLHGAVDCHAATPELCGRRPVQPGRRVPAPRPGGLTPHLPAVITQSDSFVGGRSIAHGKAKLPGSYHAPMGSQHWGWGPA